LSRKEPWRMAGRFHILQDNDVILERNEMDRFPNWRTWLYDGIHHFRILELLNELRSGWITWNKKNSATKTHNTGGEPGLSSSVYQPPLDPGWIEAWIISDKLILLMNKLSNAAAAKFAVLMIPTSSQVNPNLDEIVALQNKLGVRDLFYPDRRVSGLGLDNKFLVIAPAQRLRPIIRAQRRYMHGFNNTVLGRGHLNAYGHRLIGEDLAEVICKAMYADGYLGKNVH
jgi:hypothetical protein